MYDRKIFAISSFGARKLAVEAFSTLVDGKITLVHIRTNVGKYMTLFINL